MRVLSSTPTGDSTITTQREVEEHCSTHLQQRFSLGTRSPLSHGKLLADLGTLGDTQAAQALLRGEYSFPNDCDQATKDLLREVAAIKLEHSHLTGPHTNITSEDFTQFWKSAKERTSSSKSGRHFGHYKAVCDSPLLVSLHVRSVNLAANRGESLLRWRQGVTVLLEKNAGNICIEKLRAICLLEADFNWWLRVVFARKMTQFMHSTGILPTEQGATKGKTPIDTSLTKQLFFDQINILHEDCAQSSTDAEVCYDAVNHTAASISMQSMDVPLNHVTCYLGCVQQMQYYLRTGFGLAKESYGGSERSICMGLIQGSGAAPSAWSSVSTVIIRAYKRRGYGAHFFSGWSNINVPMTALLYVDDTDLLHMPLTHLPSEDALSQWVQCATNHWTHLLHTTGGSLNPSKCYWYFLCFKFVNGRATLKSKKELEHHKLTIPTHNGLQVQITMKDPKEPSEVLGIVSSPSGEGGPMLDHMMSKGYRWINRIKASPLQPTEVWFSFQTQAMPAVRYGLVPLMANRQHIDDTFDAWYYHCLPKLGVNRNIRKEWRTLPVSFQGLGLPYLSLEKLADSLHFIQKHWSMKTAMGNILRCGFELIQIETGLQGNFLQRNFERLGILATHSWFKVLWELLWFFHVELDFTDNVEIPQARERDKVLMEDIIKVLPRDKWESFNRVRKFHKVYFTSQLVLGDGCTINPFIFRPQHRTTSLMRFPREQPTATDFKTWKEGLHLLAGQTPSLYPPLGKLIREPYNLSPWTVTDLSCSYLVNRVTSDHYRIYHPVQPERPRRLKQFCYSHSTNIEPPRAAIAYLHQDNGNTVSLHSIMEYKWQPACPDEEKSLYRRLEASIPKQLWQNMTLCGIENWIETASEQGSLMIAHDGSFMPRTNNQICSAAIVLLCTLTGKMGHIKLCERSKVCTASNYRGELLGAVVTSHVIKMLRTKHHNSESMVRIYCDNMGVVQHTKRLGTTLNAKQPHADIVLAVTNNLRDTAVNWSYEHVHGHLDDNSAFENLTIPQQLNVIADALAKEALHEAIRTNKFTESIYPGEQMTIRVGGQKVTSSIKETLYRTWGQKIARRLFAEKQLIPWKFFDLVDWDVLHNTMQSLPRAYKVWVTKHISGFSGTNRQLSRMDPKVTEKCWCCHKAKENRQHLT